MNAADLSDEQIKAVFLSHGFKIKDGLSDLKPYVYEAARALLAAAATREERKPLGEQAFVALVMKANADLNAMEKREWDGMREFMRLVERAHGIGQGSAQ